MTFQLCHWLRCSSCKGKSPERSSNRRRAELQCVWAGSQALRTKVAAVLGCRGQGFLCPRLALQQLWFVAVVALWQTGSQEWAGSWAVTGRWGISNPDPALAQVVQGCLNFSCSFLCFLFLLLILPLSLRLILICKVAENTGVKIHSSEGKVCNCNRKSGAA